MTEGVPTILQRISFLPRGQIFIGMNGIFQGVGQDNGQLAFLRRQSVEGSDFGLQCAASGNFNADSVSPWATSSVTVWS